MEGALVNEPAAQPAPAPPDPSDRLSGVVERERRRPRRAGLSELDLRIVGYLRRNGRTTSIEIGRWLGVPETTVRAHVRSLEDEGVLQVVGRPNPYHFGFTFQVILALTFEFGAAKTASHHLLALPEVTACSLVTGRFDVLATAFLRSREDLDMLLGRLEAVPGVQKCETLVVLRVYKAMMGRTGVDEEGSWLPFRPPTGGPFALDPLDRQICEHWVPDGRVTSAEITRQLGAAPATVHRKMRRLLEQDTIRPEAWANSPAFGFEAEAILGIRTALDRTAAVAQSLTSLPPVTYLVRVAGRYDLVAGVTLTSLEDLRVFLDVDLPRIEGILAVESFFQIDSRMRMAGRIS
jgi:Lrp/AsnC family transcriptional regulator for asnA, asnC and gidA